MPAAYEGTNFISLDAQHQFSQFRADEELFHREQASDFTFRFSYNNPRRLPKSPGVHFIFSRACSFFRVYSLYLSAMLLPMSTPMTDAIIRPLVQPLESPRQWRPLTFVSKFSSILMRLE